MSDLDVLDPPATTVDYQGERLEIKPLTIGQLPKLVRTARPVIEALLASNLDQLEEGVDVDALVSLIDEHGEALTDAAALVTGKPREWIATGDLSEFATLVQVVVAVNRDFFTRKLAPLLAGRAKVPSGDGPTASSS